MFIFIKFRINYVYLVDFQLKVRSLCRLVRVAARGFTFTRRRSTSTSVRRPPTAVGRSRSRQVAWLFWKFRFPPSSRGLLRQLQFSRIGSVHYHPGLRPNHGAVRQGTQRLCSARLVDQLQRGKAILKPHSHVRHQHRAQLPAKQPRIAEARIGVRLRRCL